MISKRRIHDGVVGVVIALTVAIGHFVDPFWLWVPGILGLILVQSAITGFCPLYYILNKTIKGEPEI